MLVVFFPLMLPGYITKELRILPPIKVINGYTNSYPISCVAVVWFRVSDSDGFAPYERTDSAKIRFIKICGGMTFKMLWDFYCMCCCVWLQGIFDHFLCTFILKYTFWTLLNLIAFWYFRWNIVRTIRFLYNADKHVLK